MTSSLPSIQTLNSQKPSKSISFDVKGKKKCTKARTAGESRKLTTKLSEDVSHIGIHGNTNSRDKTTKSFGEIMVNLNKNEQEKLPITQKGLKDEPVMHRGQENAVVFRHVVQSLHEDLHLDKGEKIKSSEDVSIQVSKMLREKDREIARLREIIRKASLDRENATNADAHSRMRIAELKHKLSNQQRHVEHVTTAERLRCKEKVSNETERLRHERDDARLQLEHYEKLVWHLRKQVEQLGYLSRQRYKTIQELGKKLTAKDKSIQELRKRMEQAQLIAIPGTSLAEKRHSISNSETKNITWETRSRLATVNEK